MKKFINLLLISFILLSLTAVTAANAAGGTTFSISGKVVDRLGNPIVGADVTLIDWNYNAIRSVKTTENGNFDFINLVADTDTCKVLISYTDSSGNKYSVRPERISWYPTKGIQFVSSKETIIDTYPPPIYGYIYGAIQTDMSNSGQFINGIVYLSSLDSGGAKYFMVADRTDGKGSFQFYAPAGNYMLYAQHWENGLAYESLPKQVTIKPNTDVTDVIETRIILPLINPTNDPDPANIPQSAINKVNGTVVTKDGKAYQGATVTLLEKADNGTGYVPMKGSDLKPLTTTTDANGYFEFYGVSPTSDDGKTIQSKKDVKVMVDYTDLGGNKQTMTADNKDARPLYYPDVILGYGVEDAAHNVALPTIMLSFARDGWINIDSVPTGAFISVDGSQLLDGNKVPLQTPQTVYLEPGPHTIKLNKEGYQENSDSVTIETNKQANDFSLPLQKALVPGWVTAAAAIVILLIVIILFIVLLATRIKFLLAPVSKVFGMFGHKVNDIKANREVSKAHKAEAAEQKSQERKRQAEEKMAARRESVSASGQAKDDVPIVNVDPARRKPDAGEEGRKVIPGSKKKILDIDLKHIADSVPKRPKPREEAAEERSPVVFANDIYKKPSTDIERIPYESSTARPQPVSEREALVERPTAPDRGERFRIPRMSGQREPGSSLGDKERVLKYIRDHPEGVSFIQMSNDLEIIPNNLTYITKELVINDDIEKVKGLYYYKSHASTSDEKSSSVVVWRLDGDK